MILLQASLAALIASVSVPTTIYRQPAAPVTLRACEAAAGPLDGASVTFVNTSKREVSSIVFRFDSVRADGTLLAVNTAARFGTFARAAIISPPSGVFAPAWEFDWDGSSGTQAIRCGVQSVFFHDGSTWTAPKTDFETWNPFIDVYSGADR